MGYLGSNLTKSINTAGFRKWYEYELVRSFGYMALGVLALIASMASLENILETRISLEGLPSYLISFGGLCVAGWAWLRFVNTLIMAETLSRQAVCPSCHRYGHILVTDERSAPDQSERILSVSCKKCQHQWRIFFSLESRHER